MMNKIFFVSMALVCAVCMATIAPTGRFNMFGAAPASAPRAFQRSIGAVRPPPLCLEECPIHPPFRPVCCAYIPGYDEVPVRDACSCDCLGGMVTDHDVTYFCRR